MRFCRLMLRHKLQRVLCVIVRNERGELMFAGPGYTIFWFDLSGSEHFKAFLTIIAVYNYAKRL